jgi:hypothetical protein
MRFFAVSSSSEDVDVVSMLPVSKGEAPPNRIFVFGGAAAALRRAAEGARRQADERWIDEAGAFVLEERSGAPPPRPRPLRLLERVVVVDEGAPIDGGSNGPLQTARRGLELLGPLVLMAAASIDVVDDEALANAHVWIVGGDELPRLDERDERRIVLSPGDAAGAGGLLDIVIRRGILSATVIRDGEELASFQHALRASTKMSVRG